MGKLIIIMLLCGVCTLTAQEQTKQEFHHQIGAAGSLISGMGISYQYIFSDDYRVKCTGLYYTETKSTDYSGDRTNTEIQAGMEVQKSLFKSKNTRVFAFVGVGILSSTTFSNVDIDTRASNKQNYYHTGAGVGLELLVMDRIAFNIEVGALYSVRVTSGEIDSPKHSIYETFSRREVGFGIGGGLGIGYRF